MRLLGAGRRPEAEAKPKLRPDAPEVPPTFKDGRGRAGRFAQEPPEGDEAPELRVRGGPALAEFSRPGMDRAFILARISSVILMVGLGKFIYCLLNVIFWAVESLISRKISPKTAISLRKLVLQNEMDSVFD